MQGFVIQRYINSKPLYWAGRGVEEWVTEESEACRFFDWNSADNILKNLLAEVGRVMDYEEHFIKTLGCSGVSSSGARPPISGFINGSPFQWYEETLSYEHVVKMAGFIIANEPKVVVVYPPPDQRRFIIGPGGRIILEPGPIIRVTPLGA